MARKWGVFFNNGQPLLKRVNSLVLSGVFGLLAVAIAFSRNNAFAQIAPDKTLGSENSVVTPNVNINGIPTDRVDGGAIRGTNLFHSFLQFNIGEGGRVYFANPTGIQNIFGRITGSEPSHILGTLGVDGSANLFLLNPNGIIFGPNAKLDIRGSFVASTASSITFPNDDQFSATNPKAPPLLTYNVPIGLQYGMNQPAAIVNAGNLAVGKGQNLSLIGGVVVSTGSLEAPEGNITVASVPGSSRMHLSQAGQISNLEIESQTKEQESLLTIRPLTLSQLLASGNVSPDIGVTVNSDGTGRLTKSGINFPTEAGTSIIAGRVNVSGETGGAVNILAERVGLINANINASGAKGGGAVLIGGDYQGQGVVPNASRTFVNSNSVINADALLNGNGGRVIIWADDTTGFHGNISAKGGLNWGNGGFVEVSGKQDLVFLGNVDLSTPNGKLGTLLLDPTDIRIVTGAAGSGANDAELADGSILFIDSPGVNFTISQGTLQSQSQLGAVILQATNDIIIDPGVSLNFLGGSDAITFTADADNNGFGSFSMSLTDTITAPSRVITISGASITVGNINTRGGIPAPGGSVFLSAVGDITTGSLTVYADSDVITPTPNPFNSGDITIISTQGAIDTRGGILAAGAAEGNGGSITLKAQGNINTAMIGAGAVTGDGNGGNIQLISAKGSIDISGTAIAPGGSEPQGGLMTGFVGNKSGNVFIEAEGDIITRNVVASGTTGGAIKLISRNGNIDTTAGNISSSYFDNVTKSTSNNGGTVTIEAPKGSIKVGTIRSDGQVSSGNINLAALDDIIAGSINSSGNLGGGTITLLSNSGNIDTTAGTLNSSSGNGNGGAITLKTTTGDIIAGDVSSTSLLDSGDISFTNPLGTVSLTGVINSSAPTGNLGNGGDITITTKRFELQGEATVSVNTAGAGTGQAGKFTINASESFEMSKASRLSFTSYSVDGSGDFSINTPKLTLLDGARILVDTSGIQQAGSFIVTAPESVEVSGISPIDGSPGGLFFNTTSFANAGKFQLDTGRLIVQDGAQISNLSSGVSQGGTLAITANSVEVSGSPSGLFFNMRGSGDASGLRIDMKTGTLTVRDGAQVSVSGKGSGSAGDLTISAESIFMNNRGQLTATTDSGQGGNISLKVADSIILRNDSDIRANAFGTGNGGNINIDAGGFVLAILSENSDIIATAIQGRGGSINVAADGIFGFRLYQNVDTPESDFTASSEFGIDGTVAINTLERPQPNALPDDFLEDDIAQRCQPSSGKLASSEYVETGRGGLPSNPNSALGSNTGWVDLRPATHSVGDHSSSASATPLTDSTSEQIVEAQGWAYNAKGKLEFTNSTSNVVPYSSWFTPSACHNYNNPAQK